MDIQQLRYFAVISQTLNYTRASERLYISRQALSRTIHDMEKELGESLFFIDKNKLCPTPLARMLYENVAGVLKAFGTLESALAVWRRKQEQEREQERESLAVVFGIGALHPLPPQALFGRQAENDDAIWSFEERTDAGVREKIAGGEALLGILRTAPDFVAEFDALPLWQEGVYLLVSEKNPLAAKHWLDVNDLREQPFVTLGADMDLHALLEKECALRGFTPSYLLATLDFHLALGMAARNEALCFGSSPPGAGHASGVRLKPLKISNGAWGCYAIKNHAAAVSPSMQLFLDRCRSIYRENIGADGVRTEIA
ncbi:MAG: LysR family transcriptional regulator [Gracilibacteraceae bacterium]|jgi:DNA-binding transcriptional LysR family regulator|nr:LysR family transcriptional regulator [Gracilibacteraceae bacterium]